MPNTSSSDPGEWSWAARCLVGLSCAATLLGGGIIFGFPPLQLMLEDDGVFAGLCEPGQGACQARTGRFLILFSTGSTALMASVGVGFFVDRFGPVVSDALCGALVCTGLLLLGFSPPDSFLGLAAGAALVGFGGAFVLMASLPVGFGVPASATGYVTMAITLCFDASSGSFLFVYLVYDWLGLSRQSIMAALAAAIAVIHLGLIVAWSAGPAKKLYAKQKAELEAAEAQKAAETAGGGGAAGPSEASRQEHPLHGLPLMQQVRSFQFVFALVSFLTQMFRCNATMGTMKSLLESYGDASTGYAYTQIYTAALMVSVVAGPLISLSLSRGFAHTWLMVSALGTCWNAAALIPNLPVQLVGFLAFSVFRMFTFAVHNVYISVTFGSRTVASIHAVMAPFAMVASIMVYPCTALSEMIAEGGLTPLYAFLMLLNLPPTLLALLLWRRGRREQDGDAARKGDVEATADTFVDVFGNLGDGPATAAEPGGSRLTPEASSRLTPEASSRLTPQASSRLTPQYSSRLTPQALTPQAPTPQALTPQSSSRGTPQSQRGRRASVATEASSYLAGTRRVSSTIAMADIYLPS